MEMNLVNLKNYSAFQSSRVDLERIYLAEITGMQNQPVQGQGNEPAHHSGPQVMGKKMSALHQSSKPSTNP